MTTAIAFSRQNDVGSRASTAKYWENLVLVVVLVLESKAVYRQMRSLIMSDLNVELLYPVYTTKMSIMFWVEKTSLSFPWIKDCT